jgi:hypothetical protein
MAIPQSKSTMKRRAHELGCWEAFVARREQLKRHVSTDRAWELAATDVIEHHEKRRIAESGNLPFEDLKTPSDLLVPRAAFKATRGESREVVEWVAQNIAVADATPRDCPCPEAWALLLWVRDADVPENQQRFWTIIFPKLMPTRSALGDGGGFDDDGRRLDRLLDEVDKVCEQLEERKKAEQAELSA